MNTLKKYFQPLSWKGNDRYNGLGPRLVRIRLCPGQEIQRYRPSERPSPDSHTLSGSTSRLLLKHQCTICKTVFHKHFGLDFHERYDHTEEVVRVRKMQSLEKSVIMKWYLTEGDFIWQRRLWWHCLHWNLDIELRFGWRGSRGKFPELQPVLTLEDINPITSASALNYSTTLLLAIGYSKEP